MTLIVCAIALAPPLTPRSRAAAPPLRDPPAGSIIWYRYDPGAAPRARTPEADPLQRDLLLSAIRAGLSSGLFGNKTGAHALQALLAAAELGDTPHLAAIFDFAAHRRPNGTGMVIDRLRAVVVVDDTTRVPAYLRTIRALALATSGADPAALTQSRLRIPGGHDGVQLTSSAWPDWMALSWTVGDGRFTLAIGRGALESCVGQGSAGQAGALPWIAHREAVERGRPPRTPFLEAYVDIDALRAAFPAAFGWGRTPRMLKALGLQDASAAMLHVAALPTSPSPPAESPGRSEALQAPLIGLDWTTTSPGGLTWRPLSESSWPGDDATGLPPPPGTSILVAPVQWRGLLGWALDVYAATVPDTDLPAFAAARARWEAAHAASIDALLASLRPYLVLSDVPPPLLPVPGLATVFVGAERSPNATEVLESLFEDLIAPFSDRVVAAGRPGARTWALRLDDRGIVRLPAWGFISTSDGPLLVGGWGLPVVQENRARLATDVPAPATPW